jgi:hypothetical protein
LELKGRDREMVKRGEDGQEEHKYCGGTLGERSHNCQL